MNTEGVNDLFDMVVRLSGDQQQAKAEAQRLGLMPGLLADLNGCTDPVAAAGIARDGYRIVSIIVWERFTPPIVNGWAMLTIQPASEESTERLIELTRLLITGGSPGRLEVRYE